MGRSRVPRSSAEHRRVVPGHPERSFEGRDPDILAVHPLRRRASCRFRLTDCAGSVAFFGSVRPADSRTIGSDHLVQHCLRRCRGASEKHLWDGCSDRGARHAADISASVFRGAFRNAGWTTHGVVALAVGDSISAGTRMGDAIGLGVVLGFTTATKFTGWLAWLPTVMSQARSAEMPLPVRRRVSVDHSVSRF